MGATVNLDTLRDIAAEERGDVIFALQRSVQVVALDPDSATDAVDVVQEALNAVNLGYGDSAGTDKNLILTKRTIRMIDLDKAEVDVFYEHVSETELQDITNPKNGNLIFRIESKLESIETSVDRTGNPIWVKYAYPDGTGTYVDPSSGTLPAGIKYAGQTIRQGGKVSVRVPTKTASLVGLLQPISVALQEGIQSAAQGIAESILGRVNQGDFLGGKDGRWLCTAADYVPWDFNVKGNPVYKWRFAWEYKNEGYFLPDGKTADTDRIYLGWNPQAVFIDEETGKPPCNWKTQTSAYSFVDWYEKIDFLATLQRFGVSPKVSQ